jgi:hypothetical protein
MSVIAADVALGMIDTWAKHFDTDAPDVPHVLRAVQAGRVDLDGDSFAYTLAAAIKLENGQTLTAVTVSEPTGAQLRDATRGKVSEMETTLRTLADITAQPLGVVERFKMRDLNVLGELLSFFA